MNKTLSKKAKLNPRKIRPQLFILVFAVVGSVFVIRSFAATPTIQTIDFSQYYPNTDMYKTSYLNGNNYIGGRTSWAVLWFGDVRSNGKYRMYNSNPASTSSRCHWDLFQWTSNSLLYRETTDTCGTNNEIKYTPGLAYLPKFWNGSNWKKTGNSAANYYESGQMKCSGNNQWVSEVFAQPVELAPGVKATHMRSTQTTTWNSGPGSSTGCKVGETSRYQENLYFVTDLPIYGSQAVAKGLKRSVGGSLDFYEQRGWDWDIWFDNWKTLPKS